MAAPVGPGNCPECACGTLEKDATEAFLFCPTCGTVLEESMVDEQEVRYTEGFTQIRERPGELAEASTPRARSTVAAARARNAATHAKAEHVIRVLRLPDHVADVARDLLFRVLGDVRGHGAWVDRLAGACSLIAARQSGQPVTFADVCEAVGQPAPRVAAAYRSALETLGVEVPSHDPRALATRALGAATDFAASNARGESLKSKFQRVLSDALWLWDLCVQFSLSEGRQPLPLAAACACVAAQHEGFADVTPAALADRLPVSASSVTSRYREVLQRLRDAARVIPWFANPTDQALVSDLRLVQSFFRLSEQLGAGQQAPSATLTEVTAAALPPVLERREAEAARVRDVVAAAARDLAAASAAPGGDVAAAEGGAVRDSGADGGRGPRPAGRSRKRQREELTIRRMLLDGVPAEEIVEAHSNARRRKRGASTEPP